MHTYTKTHIQTQTYIRTGERIQVYLNVRTDIYYRIRVYRVRQQKPDAQNFKNKESFKIFIGDIIYRPVGTLVNAIVSR